LGHADREVPTRLIVIRGNSASGKSAVAAEIRRRHGRGLAIVGQDNLRRQVLRERDVPGQRAPAARWPRSSADRSTGPRDR
jgi:predicted kinase